MLGIFIALSFVFITADVCKVFAESRNDKANKQNHSEFNGTLYKIAKNNAEENTVIGFLPDRSVLAPNLRQLSRFSSDVIIGRVLRNFSYINESGDEIDKFITVFVQMVFKGTVANASEITIKQSGGSWRYSDGTTITWMPFGEAPTLDGKSYVFFMKKDVDKEYYIPSLGTQGVFEIDFDTESVVSTDLNKRDPIVEKYSNAPLEDFLDEIRSVIGEEVQ